MLLTHISNTHFRSHGRKLYGFVDVSTANADTVSQLNTLREYSDAAVASGDIVSCGRPEKYWVARQILGSLDCLLYLIPGNRDDETHLLEHLHSLYPQLGNNPQSMRRVVDDFAIRLLFIGSNRADTSEDWLTDETIGRLEAQPFEGGDKPATVFMYHPPLPPDDAQMDPIAHENGHCLLALVERFPSLARIFCGHNHSLTTTQYHQALVFIIPGTIHQVPCYHEDIRPYYDPFPASCLMHHQVSDQWVSYRHSLAHYVRPWLHDENISCLTKER